MSEHIEKIYSKIEPDKLLHMVIRYDAFNDAKFRIDACDTREWLQIAILRLERNQTFKPHKHIPREINATMIPCECWIVISGIIQCYYYDVDNQPLAERVIESGEVTITLGGGGGHTYKSLSEDSMVYEIKTPFYLGREQDKVLI